MSGWGGEIGWGKDMLKSQDKTCISRWPTTEHERTWNYDRCGFRIISRCCSLIEEDSAAWHASAFCIFQKWEFGWQSTVHAPKINSLMLCHDLVRCWVL